MDLVDHLDVNKITTTTTTTTTITIDYMIYPLDGSNIQCHNSNSLCKPSTINVFHISLN